MRACERGIGTLPPPLLDHGVLPFLFRPQDLLLIPTDLGLHDFELRADEQPHLPPELMREQGGSRLATVFLEAEQVAQLNRRPVPVGALKNLEGHGGGMVARHSPAQRWCSSEPQTLLESAYLLLWARGEEIYGHEKHDQAGVDRHRPQQGVCEADREGRSVLGGGGPEGLLRTPTAWRFSYGYAAKQLLHSPQWAAAGRRVRHHGRRSWYSRSRRRS